MLLNHILRLGLLTQFLVQTVITSLESGHSFLQPFTSVSISPTSTIQISQNMILNVASTSPTMATSQNVFVAIASDAPPQQIRSCSDHPVPQLGITKQSGAYETNKFYSNLFLGEQNNAIWSHPYSVAWSRGSGNTNSWGLAISHIERSQLTWASGKPPEYFINPIGIKSVIISAAELGNSTAL